jgi:hypothetical protein
VGVLIAGCDPALPTSVSSQVGGANCHSPDKRLVALDALKEQRRKKWWIKGGEEPAPLMS